MINKPVSTFFSFFLLFECIALICLSFNIQAATVDIADNDSLTPYSSLLPSADNNEIISYPSQNAAFADNISNTNVSVQQPAYITPSQYNPYTPTNNNHYSNIKKIGATFLYENADNKLLQDSLVVFSNAKRLYNETDSMLNDLAQDILLELDQHLQIELSLTQEINDPRSFTYANQQQNNFNLAVYRQNTISTLEINDEMEAGFLGGILNITNLFYLLGFIILFSFCNWLLRFILLGKYR